jgi:hypothetical protein
MIAGRWRMINIYTSGPRMPRNKSGKTSTETLSPIGERTLCTQMQITEYSAITPLSTILFPFLQTLKRFNIHSNYPQVSSLLQQPQFAPQWQRHHQRSRSRDAECSHRDHATRQKAASACLGDDGQRDELHGSCKASCR